MDGTGWIRHGMKCEGMDGTGTPSLGDAHLVVPVVLVVIIVVVVILEQLRIGVVPVDAGHRFGCNTKGGAGVAAV